MPTVSGPLTFIAVMTAVGTAIQLVGSATPLPCQVTITGLVPLEASNPTPLETMFKLLDARRTAKAGVLRQHPMRRLEVTVVETTFTTQIGNQIIFR
jgi:hypothetical protein